MSGPKAFEESTLATMIEPLKVRVVRHKNHQKMPIPLPPSNSGDENGEGWTKLEVRELEAFLVNQWSGGGLYSITVTDSSENPISMTWQPYWPPVEYPERPPPSLAEGRSPDAPQPIQIGSNTGVPRMAFINPPQQAQQFYPTISYGGQNAYPMPQPPPVGTPQYNAWSAEAKYQETQAENRKLREETKRREQEAREERHRAELERVRAANDERFSKLESTIMALVGGIKEGSAAPKGPTQAELDMQRQIAELKESNRRAEERAEAAQRVADADRRESQMRDLIRQQAEDARRSYEGTQQQISTLQREFQTMITNLTTQLSNSAKASDPLVEFLRASEHNHAEVLKEMARENNAAMQRFQSFMMNPVELMRLARESQDGIEKAIERTTRFTDNVVGMQQRVLENALSMQPQGNGVIEVVSKGLTDVKEFFERFVTSKSKEAIAGAQAQAEVARAQAHAVEVHARATNPQAFAQPGLSGPADVQQQQQFTPPPPPATATAIPVTDQPDEQRPRRIERLWGRTDEEWFGQALPDVLNLRAGVAQFMLAVAEYERTGSAPEKFDEIPGTRPVHAARAIGLAVAVAQQQGLVIPAIIELLLPGMLPEFVTVLLPDAPQKYRDDVVLQATKLTQAEDEDEDDDDEDPDAGAADAQEAPQPTTPQPKPRARGQRRSN